MHIRKKTILASTVAVGLVAGGFWYYFRQSCLPHFYEVGQGALYRSGQPRGLGLRALPLWGISTSINLRGAEADGVQAEREFAEKNGIAFHNIPAGSTAMEIDASVGRFLAILDDPSNWPVLVHCSRGKERSGVFSAVYHMEYDRWSNQKALHEMYDLGLAPGSMPIAETFVWEYQPRWRSCDVTIAQNAEKLEMRKAAWRE